MNMEFVQSTMCEGFLAIDHRTQLALSYRTTRHAEDEACDVHSHQEDPAAADKQQLTAGIEGHKFPSVVFPRIPTGSAWNVCFILLPWPL